VPGKSTGLLPFRLLAYVMVRWVRKTNPLMIKQFIYMYSRWCIFSSDSRHVDVIIVIIIIIIINEND